MQIRAQIAYYRAQDSPFRHSIIARDLAATFSDVETPNVARLVLAHLRWCGSGVLLGASSPWPCHRRRPRLTFTRASAGMRSTTEKLEAGPALKFVDPVVIAVSAMARLGAMTSPIAATARLRVNLRIVRICFPQSAHGCVRAYRWCDVA